MASRRVVARTATVIMIPSPEAQFALRGKHPPASRRSFHIPRKIGSRNAPPVGKEGAHDAQAEGNSFPVVAIGASAGGLAALEEFFSAVSGAEAPGVAFIVVQHLVPDQPSMLATLVQRRTGLRVSEAEDGMPVEMNAVYVNPPNREVILQGARLRLTEPAEPRAQRLPIDVLFRSLAAERGHLGVAIVLSGAGSDGTLGARAVKAAGGLVIAQEPRSAQFEGMPASVIATGVVDLQLEPGDMPARVLARARRATVVPPGERDTTSPQAARSLLEIFEQLHVHTGHDFSNYKPSTSFRRIERRMAAQHIATLEGYVSYLQDTPTEARALFQELLIGVTSFFRDPEAFHVLESEVIPALFESHADGGTIRVWSAGCSTGEEAYSIAILLQERLEALRSNCRVQVFATDIDGRAIATARAGHYPAEIAADITPERLARFFTTLPDGRGYRIRKNIRDLLVLSEHNLIKDPPFSKLDLISCRNVLIYFGVELQRRLIPRFHYALLPGGTLFLGTSETVGESTDLFLAQDRRSKVYRRSAAAPRAPAAFEAVSPGRPPQPPSAAEMSAPNREASRRAVTESALLRHASLVAALVNEGGDILYLHGRSGMYLETPAGVAGPNHLLAMCRDGLRVPLALALQKARSTTEPVRVRGVRVRSDRHITTTNLTICRPTATPPTSRESAQYLVILQDVTTDSDPPISLAPAARSPDVEEELHAKEEHLLAANEQLATANEELHSSNEELQSVNEELQSSNEELETSKGEVQSMNEELVTVNAELQAKLTDLSRASNDMNNLLASTGVGTVFLDPQLRLLRFTPSATRIIHLIPSDVGRPIAHIAANLVGYHRLVEDAQAVLDTLTPVETDVQAHDGVWYRMRILPYRTIDNVVEGAVITFIEITDIVHAREALQKADGLLRLAVVVRDAYDAITVQDLQGRILAWNPGAVRMYGWTESEALALKVTDRVPESARAGELSRLRQLSEKRVIEGYRTRRCTRSGAELVVWITATALVNEAGVTYAIATTERSGPLRTRSRAGAVRAP